MTKKAIALLASCILGSSSVPFLCAGNACSVSAETLSGKCGQNARWSFDSETGLLLITGSGKMNDYDHPLSYNAKSISPWYDLREEITCVRIENGISAVGSASFVDCTSLKTAELPDSLLTVGADSFNGCAALETFNIPIKTNAIAARAFSGCTSLREIAFPSSLTSIGPASFYNCTSLAKAEFSEGLEEIADNAFSNCESLTSVTLPKSLTNIADDALGLQLIPDIYDSGVDDYKKYDNFQINGYEGSAAQKYAKRWGFQFSIISPYPPAPEFAEGDCGNGISWEFSKDTGTLLIKGSGIIPDYSSKEAAPPWQSLSGAITSVVIDDNVTAIGSYSFKGMTGLRSLTLPDTLLTIGKAAFADCNVLGAADIPASVRTIEDSAFSGCNDLKELAFSKGLETIGSYAFYGCSSLEKAELPDGISAVGDDAFTNCTSLNYISIPATCKSLGEYAFGFTYSDGTYLTYCPDTAIYGSKGSAAERYAADYDIRFVSTDPEPITTTVCTTTAVTTTTTADDTVVRLCSWAVKDYQDRKGLTGVTAKLLSASPDNYVIALYDKNGKLLEVYTVDPSTGIGTDSAGYTVDLPQTGNNSPKDLLILAAAFAMTLSGLAAVWRSGFLRRKKNEQQ